MAEVALSNACALGPGWTRRPWLPALTRLHRAELDPVGQLQFGPVGATSKRSSSARGARRTAQCLNSVIASLLGDKAVLTLEQVVNLVTIGANVAMRFGYGVDGVEPSTVPPP